VRRIRRSSVPWTRSVGFVTFALVIYKRVWQNCC